MWQRMMYWIGFLLFTYLIVSMFILGSMILGRYSVVAKDEYSLAEMVAMALFCALLWPVAMYQGRLKVRWKKSQ